MSILSYKYKAHKLVNTLFYIVVFGIGFVLGFGAEKIDFNKLVSQVLMIDNAKAYNITSTIDEDYIVEKFSQDADFDITIYKNIFCLYNTKSTSSQYCYAFTDDALSKTTFSYSTSGNIDIRLQKQYISNISPSPTMQLNLYDNTITKQNLYSSDIWITQKYSSYNNYWYFSFIPDGFNESSWFGTRKLLDFSEYAIKVEYNENLFKDNPDFKEVCVPNNKKFGITSKDFNVDENITDETLNNRVLVERDFIWFPNGLTGLKSYFYHNQSKNNVFEPTEEDIAYNMYFRLKWLKSKEDIDDYFNSNTSVGKILEEANYIDKYKYYNYTAHPFLIRFVGYEEDYMFNVFSFEEQGISYIDSDVVDYPEEYCFYIKNQYDVVLMNENEWGDIYVDTTILGDTNITVSTSKNESEVNSKGLFSTITTFVSNIMPTISFINTNIYNFYLSMPVLVRMFILSLFTILIVKFLIDMVVK